MRIQQDPLSAIRWLPVYNAGATPVPPYGVMKSNGWNADQDAYSVVQPDGDSLTEVFINGPVAIPPSTRNQAHRADPCRVLVETADGTPATGDDYGTEANSWKLHKNKTGFRVIAAITDDPNTAEMTFLGVAYNELSSGSVSVSVASRHVTGTVDHGQNTSTTGGFQQFGGPKAFVNGILLGPNVPESGDTTAETGGTAYDAGGKIWFDPPANLNTTSDDLFGRYMNTAQDVSQVQIFGYVRDTVGDQLQHLSMRCYNSDDSASATIDLNTSDSDLATLQLGVATDGATNWTSTILMAPNAITITAIEDSGSAISASIIVGYAGGSDQGITVKLDELALLNPAGASQGTGYTGTTGGMTFYCGWFVSGTPGGYTEEEIEDIVGGMITAPPLSYDDGSNTFSVLYQMSITADASGLKLVGDQTSPGNSKYYGTDGAGVKGWYASATGTGDVTAAANIADNVIVRGDGGLKGIQGSTATLDDNGNIVCYGVEIRHDDATTNAVKMILHLIHTSTGTAANGFGTTTRYTLESASGTERIAAETDVLWVDASDAGREAQQVFRIYDTASREGFRIEADGSAPRIGFLGAGAAPRQSGDAGTALVTFGLMSGTPTFAWANITSKPTIPVSDVIVLREEQTSGTLGGTFTSGAWRTRTLNTEAYDPGGHCSLSSNQFTLAAGTYEIYAVATAYAVDQHQTRLQNVSDGTTTMMGATMFAYSVNFGQNVSNIYGVFTIAATKTFELQHRCATTKSTDGYGTAGSFGTEVYSQVFLRKVA